MLIYQNGQSALHIAVVRQLDELVVYLLLHKCMLNKVDSFGKRPLDYALQLKNEEITKVKVVHISLSWLQVPSLFQNILQKRNFTRNGLSMLIC